MNVSFCDEGESGFGWIASEPGWMGRSSPALLAGRDVWLVDPVDFAGLDERLGLLGEPRGVLQLFGSHRRDCATIAARLAVPHLTTPDVVPASPFEAVSVRAFGGWRETALWWPEARTLIVTEALGTARYFRAPGR